MLIGLMVRASIDYSLPPPETFQSYIDQTQALLLELHHALSFSWLREFTPEEIVAQGPAILSRGASLREPIFYGGESAFASQYRDFAGPKYAADNAWLSANKGFVIEDAVHAINAACRFHERKLSNYGEVLSSLPIEEWTYLEGFVFTAPEISEQTGLEISIIENIFTAFSLPEEEHNAEFKGLNDYNAANAFPIIRHPKGYIFFQHYNLLEALYETPFFWMVQDKKYLAHAQSHRGDFTENTAFELLERVFGARVHPNVEIQKGKGATVGEIDVLVLFGDIAIVLQAKSKRLTIGARKGNDLLIQDDFKKAVQDACDQAVLCAQALLDPNCVIQRRDGVAVQLPKKLRQIHPISVVADHYPALSFQARQFLQFTETAQILPPLVTDIFALDTITEILRSPLRFLHYLRLRARFDKKIMATQELTILAYHLQGNLWVADDQDFIALTDDLADDLNVAMMVRREGVSGDPTPKGILTKFQGTVIGRLIDQIDQHPDEEVTELGIIFLNFSEKTLTTINRSIERITTQTQADGQRHDFTFTNDEASTGVTIYSATHLDDELLDRFRTHCHARKYSRKAQTWHGMIVRALDFKVMASLHLDSPWVHDDAMEQLLPKLSDGMGPEQFAQILDSPAIFGPALPKAMNRQQRRAQERALKKRSQSKGTSVPSSRN